MRTHIGILVAFVALVVGGSAQAIIGGSVDMRHTYVGAATQTQTQGGVTGTQLCSGALISPTVFLTAAHCFPDQSTATVTFATNALAPDVTYSGTVFDSTTADLAVIVFEDPITNVGLAKLPSLGFDDTLPNNQLVDVVGYGISQFDHRNPIPASVGLRRLATTPVKSAGNESDQSLKLLAAPGGCLGDSGGPNLVSGTDTIVAITTGGNSNCKGVSFSLRVDTPVARQFLGQFVSLP